KNRFRDVRERMATLRQLSSTLDVPGADNTLAQTVAIDANVRPLKLGRYQIDRELGRGAMGVVYQGHDPKISRKVAIKTLNARQLPGNSYAELKARFFREAEAAGRLNHPGIVTIFDVGEEANLSFIAMDLIEGQSLEHFCLPDRLLPMATVYHIVLKVA